MIEIGRFKQEGQEPQWYFPIEGLKKKPYTLGHLPTGVLDIRFILTIRRLYLNGKQVCFIIITVTKCWGARDGFMVLPFSRRLELSTLPLVQDYVLIQAERRVVNATSRFTSKHNPTV